MIVSVIIPTYNRKQALLRALNSLRRQTLPADKFEVLVVDDGSPDDMADVVAETFPFAFKYLRQSNGGATSARNYGVTQSVGQILVFIDDDITISPPTLAALVQAIDRHGQAIVMGQLISRAPGKPSIFAELSLAVINNHHVARQDTFVPCADCNTELLAV